MQTKNHPVSKRIHPGSWPLRYFFFVSGIVATIAYRITPFLTPMQVKVAWYVGTVGFILYFLHRTQVETKRAHLVRDYSLVSIVEKSDIPAEEKSAVSYLVKTSLTSKARFNSIFILVASLLALLFALAVDLGIHP